MHVLDQLVNVSDSTRPRCSCINNCMVHHPILHHVSATSPGLFYRDTMQSMKHLMIAHRGDTNNFPENTPTAFASAFSSGADGVELDIQEQDGEIIVVHNYLYDKTKSYPRLVDILKQFAGKGRLEIEVKSLDLRFLDPLETLLKPYSGADIELTTSVAGLVNHLRSTFKDFLIGVIFQEREFEDWMTEEDFVTTKVTKLMQLYGADVAHAPYRVIHSAFVNSLHDLGMKVHVHIPRQPMADQLEIYNRLGQLGVDQSTFDDIDMLTKINGKQ